MHAPILQRVAAVDRKPARAIFAEELGFKLIEASLSPEVQTTLMNSPYLIVPTNFSGLFPACPLRQAVRRQPQARIPRASPHPLAIEL